MSKQSVATMTLNEYATEYVKEGVVVFWAGVGFPTGEHEPAGHPDMNYGTECGLYDLSGTVDEEGDWQWDGEGKVYDHAGNTIYQVQAFRDEKHWQKLVDDYENE